MQFVCSAAISPIFPIEKLNRRGKCYWEKKIFMNHDAGIVPNCHNMNNRILTLLKKDLVLELRQQHTFYGVLLYIASTIFVLYLSIDEPAANVWNGLFWVIQLFVCIN